MVFQTEIEFTLPKGFLDNDGILHREGVMRLATAADEILPLKDPRVQQNPAYLTVIVLSRVITRLGQLTDINTKIIEGLFASDLNFLQTHYEKLNSAEADVGVGVDVGVVDDDGFRQVSANGGAAARGFGVVGEA